MGVTVGWGRGFSTYLSPDVGPQGGAPEAGGKHGGGDIEVDPPGGEVDKGQPAVALRRRRGGGLVAIRGVQVDLGSGGRAAWHWSEIQNGTSQNANARNTGRRTAVQGFMTHSTHLIRCGHASMLLP